MKEAGRLQKLARSKEQGAMEKGPGVRGRGPGS